jgi:hypothetical protein
MQEIYKVLIGIGVLFLGVPIGNYLAKLTRDEYKDGKKYFISIILISALGAIIGLITRNDVLLFTFLFIMVVTFRSLK